MAAEANRKAEARAIAEAEITRKAEEAREVAEAKTTADRLAAERKASAERDRQAEAARAAEAEAEAKAQAEREAVELARSQQRELQDARDAFAVAVSRAPDAFFFQAWGGRFSREWFEKNITRGDIGWIGKTRLMFDSAMGDYKRKEALAAAEAKAEFETFIEAIDLDVFSHIRLGQGWNSRRTTRVELILLARIGVSAREMIDIRTAVARAIVLRDQARHDAQAELERKKLDPKSEHFDYKAYAIANLGKSPPSVRPISKEELARQIRRMNGEPEPKQKADESKASGSGGGSRGYVAPKVPSGIAAKAAERDLLNVRIRALAEFPKVVFDTWAGNKGWRWQTVEAMLGVSVSDRDANRGLAEFVGKCESVKAKRKGR